MKQRYLATYQKIRSFPDVLPPTLVTAADGDFKCRGNIMCGIASTAKNLLVEGIIVEPATIESVQEYLDFVAGKDFSIFSTQEDIAKVNHALDVLIQALS